MESQETKIRRGQAYNLAVHDAVANKMECSPQYIYRKVVYYLSLGDALQGSDANEILEVIEDAKFAKLVKEFQEYFIEYKKLKEAL